MVKMIQAVTHTSKCMDTSRYSNTGYVLNRTGYDMLEIYGITSAITLMEVAA